MSDPERLLSDGTEFERELLAGAAIERPSAAMSRRMAVGVGVGGAVGYTTLAKAMVATWWGKAVIGTVVGTVVATSVVVGGGESEKPAEVAKPAAAVQKVESAPALIEAPLKPRAETVEEATDLEQVDDKPTVRLPKAKPAAKKSTLGEEIRMIDQARALVKSGKTSQALSVLDRYSQKFPSGVLKHEAGVLRTQAKNSAD